MFLIRPLQVLEQLSLRDHSGCQDLSVPDLSDFLSEKVSVLIERKQLSFSVCGREDSRNVVEAEGNAQVLCNVTRVKDVGPCGRDDDVKVGLSALFSNKPHFLQEVGNLIHCDLQAKHPVTVAKVHRELCVVQVGSYGLGSIGLDDLDGFDSEEFFAVGRELGHGHVEHDVGSVSVGGCDLDENVGGVDGDFVPSELMMGGRLRT